MRFRLLRLWLAPALLALVLPAAGATPLAAAPPEPQGSPEVPWTEVSLEGVNGVYSNPNPELEPVRRGPLTIHLRSPENRVRLASHRLWLSPRGGGRHAARLTAVIEGGGQLEADLVLAGSVQQLSDEVRLPRQRLNLEGEVRLARADGGYRITAVSSARPTVSVAIESDLVDDAVATCQQVARLLLLSSTCNVIGIALSHAVVPLPEPGTRLFLADAQLTESDRARLDAYLGQAPR